MIDLGTLQNVYTVAKQIYDVVQSIKNAPEAIRELERQTILVRGVLEALQCDLEGREDAELVDWSTEPCFNIIERAQELIKEAEKFLRKATKETNDGRKTVRKVEWILFAQSDAQALTTKFQAFYGSLCMVYSAIQLQQSRRDRQKTNEAVWMLMARQEESVRMSEQATESTMELRRMLSETQEQMRQVMYTAAKPTIVSESNDQSRGDNLAFNQAWYSPNPPGRRAYYDCPEYQKRFPESVCCEGPACCSQCRCRCHNTPKSIIPSFLTSLLGRLYLPQSVSSALSQPRTHCDDPLCRRQYTNLMTIKYYFPSWFKLINAEIRVERQSFVHVSLRMPRVVDWHDLDWLDRASLEQVRKRLWTRELTVNDVLPSGSSVLHILKTRMMSEGSEMMASIVAFLTEHWAPTEWDLEHITYAEHALQWSLLRWRRHGSREAAIWSLETGMDPLLSHDLAYTWENLAIQRGWTDLHRRLCALPSHQHPSVTFTCMPPKLLLQVNTKDSVGHTPLFFAMIHGPDALDTLLRAGANPLMDDDLLVWAVRAGADTCISMLVRSGSFNHPSAAAVDTTLQWAASCNLASSINRYAVALELVRHAGHLLQDVSNILGSRRDSISSSDSDEEYEHIIELYRTRQLPKCAQYLPTPDMSTNDNKSDLPSTSLIRAGLNGDIVKIGDLIQQGAMVNESDPEGRTLLHLVALGRVRSGYRVILELVRYGGWGVNWDASIYEGSRAWTALEIAESRLDTDTLDEESYKELEKVRDLLRARRLPSGVEYLWPCMSPEFHGAKDSPLRIPGAWNGS